MTADLGECAMLKRLRDFLALSMGISTPGAEPNELKWDKLQREREEQKKRSDPASSQQTPSDRSSVSGSNAPR